MNTTELISQLVKDQGGPCALDTTYLPYSDPAAGAAVKFGLGGELFLDHQDRHDLRDKMRDFLVSYWERFPDELDQILPADAKRAKKFKGNPADIIDTYNKKQPLTRAYSVSLFGSVDIGLPVDDIDPYQASGLTTSASDQRSSFVRASMPLCGKDGRPQSAELLSAFLQWCRLFKPLHGSAGFTLIFCPGMEQNSVQCLQLMKRFPGFDFPDPVRFIGETDGVRNRIKSVNWLTVLSDPLLEELGGLATLRRNLEPSCTIHEYEGGILIQAGETPRLGDTERSDIPEEYRRVARATRPVRFEDYSSALFRVEPALDKKKETLAWIHRFD
ncbi:Protein of unknown function [Roseateles sp. YR242]|uniref:type VI immunity family protein n=1 Tax=Roseateles sp. YR242 TaxID=1855305 RepID=UPI0008AEF44D|nr:type VI immunity family protein [Roseateles sp. YR242]SEK95181.1 Protein of unknown function [Roseateles sp. YR242]